MPTYANNAINKKLARVGKSYTRKKKTSSKKSKKKKTLLKTQKQNKTRSTQEECRDCMRELARLRGMLMNIAQKIK